MKPHSLRNVTVWIEDAQSDDKVLAQALDWACRLSLPIRAVVSAPHPQRPTPVVAKLEAWGLACTQRGVALEILQRVGGDDATKEDFLPPCSLCVFVEGALSGARDKLLRRSAQSCENAVLLCSVSCPPLTRILVLHDQANPDSAYLESAARICQALEIRPVILIVAKTERDADLRQASAAGVCHSLRLAADFDLVVGCDFRSAVCHAALWRSCSHLIVERQIGASWWGRSHGSGLEPFRELTESLSVLALPESVVLDVPHKIRNVPSIFPGQTQGLRPGNPLKQNFLTEVCRD